MINFFSVLIVLFFLATLLMLIFKLFNLKKKYSKVQSDITKLIYVMTKMRYGHLDTRLEHLSDSKLENTANRLIETINDREEMIKEYQTILSDKNEKLEEMYKIEKEQQEFKDDFVATLSHDMKVPVIAELNTLNFLLEGRFGELNDKQKEVLNLMKNSNRDLIELIQTLLDVYKLQENEIILKKEPVKINTLISETIEELTPIAFNNQNGFEVNIEETENKEIEIDVFNIKRVIKNLLANAISFSPNGEKININTSLKSDGLYINVSNYGHTISEEDLSLIFNKFYCGNSKFRRLGTGLGLYLSNKIVQAHLGSITVSSEDNKTTFSIKLPVQGI
ncbi:HAMP domain-containing histidine kinase [bacterium]|nr:HAMP domain-containing histidine kinase [bacterium]